MPPDQIIGARAVAAGRDDGRLGERLQLRLDADRREILLDRLRDARVGIGVVDVELGREAVGEAGVGEELLRAFRIVGVARDSP